jgi:inner membrane protein
MAWFIVFASTVFALYFWRQFQRYKAEKNSPLAAQNLGMRFIGQALVLEQSIEENSGQIWLGNRSWKVRGPNLPAGSRVRVTGVDGTILLVDKAPAS